MAKLGVPQIHKEGPFVGPKTFMNVPYSTDFSTSQAVILGVPFDGAYTPLELDQELDLRQFGSTPSLLDRFNLPCDV
jgi:hypothetical protein